MRPPCFAVLLLAILAAGPALAHQSASNDEESEGSGVIANRISWSTSSEIDNFGYDIYRALREEGPFERITADPVLGAGTTDEPSTYEYFDDTIEECTIYFYYVESVSMGGERERFTPVFAAKKKGECIEQDGAAGDR